MAAVPAYGEIFLINELTIEMGLAGKSIRTTGKYVSSFSVSLKFSRFELNLFVARVQSDVDWQRPR